MSNTFGSDPQLQVIDITDFSAGIVQYGTVSNPTQFSSTAPKGSASFAARCVNRPGIGLVPFYRITTTAVYEPPLAINSPAGNPFTQFINTGIGSIGGVISNVSYDPYESQASIYSDLLVVTICAQDSAGNEYLYGALFFSDGTTPFTNGATLWGPVATTLPVCTSFDITSQVYTGTSNPAPILLMGNAMDVFGPGAPFVPNVGAGWLGSIGATNFAHATATFAHTNRCLALLDKGISVAGGAAHIQYDQFVYYTNPPAAPGGGNATEVSTPNSYSLENTSGFGAWGSVSTGELILIRRGNGAVMVSGDAAFPSSVIKLPSVQGTGAIMQRMSLCNVGAVYVTESNGVWAWNGGNTALKVSTQIPDNACIRPELEPGGFDPVFGAVGVRAHHDTLNGYVFFANNWVFDSINNSWWMCEDPAVLTLATWTASKSTSSFIFGTPAFGDMSPPPTLRTHTFNANLPSTTWQWISNPIPLPPGNLPSLQTVEICASNPFNADSTIEVTPQVPNGYVSSFANNPQSVTFTVPAFSAGYRASLRLGFTENNMCVNIEAAGGSGAPTLHELYLGYTTTRTSGAE